MTLKAAALAARAANSNLKSNSLKLDRFCRTRKVKFFEIKLEKK